MALIFLGALIVFTAVSVHMTFSDEDKILIQNLYHLDGYKATMLMNKFPNKWWTNLSCDMTCVKLEACFGPCIPCINLAFLV